jgi:hypothetical protein
MGTLSQSRREMQRKIDRINQPEAGKQDLLDGDALAQNSHRDEEAAKVSKLYFAASSSRCIMLIPSMLFLYPVYPVNPVKSSLMRSPRSLRLERA